VPQDLLEAEHVAAVDEVAAGKRMTERVRAAAGRHAGSPAKASDRDLDAAPPERALAADERAIGRTD
jgi:hypothetical protein